MKGLIKSEEKNPTSYDMIAKVFSRRINTMNKISLGSFNTSVIVLFIVLLSTSMSVSSANETSIMPFRQGSFQQIQRKHIDQPYIIAFWSETCGYCMKELALLGKLIKKHPDVGLVTISTDPFLDEERLNTILASKNLQNVEKWVFADRNTARLYAEVGKTWRGELPLTYFFERDNKKIKHLGTINEQELITWFADQSNIH